MERPRLLIVLKLGWGTPGRLKDAILDFQRAVERAAGAKATVVDMATGMGLTAFAVPAAARPDDFLADVTGRLRELFNFGSGFEAGQDGAFVVGYRDCAASDGERHARLVI